jgi:hypothetical protein
VADAQDAVDAAQRKLNASTPEERGRRSTRSTTPSRSSSDAKRRSTRRSPTPSALSRTPFAGSSTRNAARRTHTASSRDAQADQPRGPTTRRRSRGRTTRPPSDDVNAALIAQARRRRTRRTSRRQRAGIKTVPCPSSGTSRRRCKDLADELDPNSDLTKRIGFLLASMTSDTAQRILTISKPGEVQRFASGGFAPPNSLFEMSEAGPEAVVMPHGIYRAPPGGVQVLNARDTVAASGRSFNQTNYVTVQSIAEPAERAIRRELDRLSWQAGG